MFDLKDKVILITGAAGGIATSVIPEFKRYGARIIGADRNGDDLKLKKKRSFLDSYISGDLTSSAVQNKIISKYASSVDVLINNVGGGYSKSLKETTWDDYFNLWKLNFGVAAMLCQGIVPIMAKRGYGKVINVSTVLAENPLPELSAYTSSKAALIAFTRSIAIEYAPFNINANVIAPGYIRNKKHKSYFASETGKKFIKQFMPTGRIGNENSLNGIFLFLASSASDHITGQIITVDEGYSIW